MQSDWARALRMDEGPDVPPNDLWEFFGTVALHHLGAAQRRSDYTWHPSTAPLLMAVFSAASGYSRGHTALLKHYGLVPQDVLWALDGRAGDFSSQVVGAARAYGVACAAMLSLLTSDDQALSFGDPVLRESFVETGLVVIRDGAEPGASAADEAEYRLLDRQYVYDTEHRSDPTKLLPIDSAPALSLLLFARNLTGEPAFDLQSVTIPSGSFRALSLPTGCITFLRRIGYLDVGWYATSVDQLARRVGMLEYARVTFDEDLVEVAIEEADAIVEASS